MAAEVVGSAYVIIRAITTKIASDIKDGLDKGAKDADVEGAGETLGDRLGNSIKDGLERSGALDSGLNDVFDSVGERAAERMTDSMSDSLDEAAGPLRDSADRMGEGVGDRIAEGMRRAAHAQLAADGPADWLEAADADAAIDRKGQDHGSTIAQAMRRAAMAQLAANGPADWIEATQDESRVGNVFTRLFSRMRGRFSGGGDGLGGSFADGFSKGWSKKNPLSRLLDGISLSPMLTIFLTLVPAIGGALKIVGGYLIGLVAQLGFVATAAAGAAAALAGFGAGAAVGILPLFLAFKANTPALERFKEKMTAFGDEWKSVGEAAQIQLLPALERSLGSLTKLIPAFEQFGFAIGGIAGRTAEMVSGFLASEDGQRNLNKILFGSVGIWQQLQRVVVSLFMALLPFLSAAMPIAVRFATSLGNIAEKMAIVARAGEADGSLQATLGIWYDRAELVARAIGDILVAIWNTFKIGAAVATPFFDTFANFAQRWRDFTESSAGKNRIAEIFMNAVPVMQEVNRLIRDIILAIFEPVASGDNAGILSFLRTLRTELLPAIITLAGTLADNAGPALQDFFLIVTDLFTRLSESGALGSFLSTLTSALTTFAAVLDNPVFGAVVPKFLLLLGTMKALNTVTFGGFSKAIGGLVSGLWSVTGAQAAFAAVGPAFTAASAAAGGGFAGLTAGAGAAATAIWAAMAPLLIFVGIVVAVVAAVLAVVWAFRNWDKIKEWVDKAWDAVWDFITKLPGRIAGAARALWQWIQDAIPMAVQKIGEWARSIGEFVARLPGMIWGWISGAASALWEWVQDAIPFLARAYMNYMRAVGGFLISLPGRIIGFLARAVPALFEWIGRAIPGVLSAMARFIGFTLGFLVSLPGRIVGVLATAIPALFGWIVDAVPGLLSNLAHFVGFLIGFLVSLPVRLIELLWNAGQALIGWVIDAGPGLLVNLGTFLLNIAQWVTQLPGRLIGWLTSAIPAFIRWVTDAIPGLLANLGSFLARIGTWAAGLPGRIISFLTTAIPAMMRWAADAASQIPGKLADFASNVWTWITDFVRELPERFAGIVDRMLDVGRDIVHGMWDGIIAAKDWLMDKVGGLVGDIVGGFIDGFKVWSPSRVMRDRVGVPITQGIGVGMEKSYNSSIPPATRRITDKLVDSFNGVKVPVNLAPTAGSLSALGSLSSGLDLSGATAINAGSMSVALQVYIGDRDITDIVDVRISDRETVIADEIYMRGVGGMRS